MAAVSAMGSARRAPTMQRASAAHASAHAMGARVIARAKARLRPRRAASAACFEAAGIFIDPAAHEAALHDVALKLTPKEFGILLELVKAAGNPVPAKELYESVWGERFALSAGNSVMVHIRRLREKLAAVDSSRELIATVWGVGYRINTGRAGR